MRNSPRKYTKEEVDWLKENYPIYGSVHCANELDITLEQIRNKIRNLKLNKVDKIDTNQFKNIQTKEVAYIMGFIWADGHINMIDEGIYKGSNKICVNIKLDDIKYIKDVFMKTGDWNYCEKVKINQGHINIGQTSLYRVFENYKYKEKSQISPENVINSIPEKLQHYFFRGLIDGDGCFYINKPNYTRQFIVASTFEQDWTYMIKLCEKLNIPKYRIDKNINEKSKSSSFRICRKDDIIKVGNYIYQDFSFGFKRKYNKFMEIKNS